MNINDPNFWNNLWNDRFVVAIIAAVIGYIIPVIPKIVVFSIKKTRLNALNNYLKYKISPILSILRIIIYIFGIVSLALLLYQLYDRKELNYIAIIFVFLGLIIHILFEFWRKKEKKGLVGLLSSDFKSIKEINYTESDDIYFVKIKNDKGDKLSYEDRIIINDEEEIRQIVENKILSYYSRLSKKIQSEILQGHIKKEKNFKVTYKGEELQICDFMKKIYSVENIKKHIDSVSRNMGDDNSINFIGDKIGVSSYILENGNLLKDGNLSLCIYMTDHFTFNVFKSIFEEKDNKEVFQTIISRVNVVSEIEKRYLVSTMKFLFSSFGIDIIIHGITSSKKKAMLLGVRSGRIERKGEAKIHVPVNESFSRTDGIDNTYNLYACVKRGIEEELGIPQNLIKDDCITFCDFAMVADAGEIGLGCYVDFSSIMTLEQACLYPGQDKYMEMDNLLIVPYPPFRWNPDDYIDYFYKKTYNDILTTPWESFTPLLYQRLIVRNMNISSNNIFVAFIISILMLMSSLIWWVIDYCSIIDIDLNALFKDRIVNFSVGSLGLSLRLLVEWIRNRINIVLFKPLIPQWGGDVRVLQSIYDSVLNRTTTGGDSDKFYPKWYFCIEEPNQAPISCGLNNLKFSLPPLCKVRRELPDRRESPIGLYIFQYQNRIVTKSRLYFSRLMLKYIDGELVVKMSIIFDGKGNYTYSFKEYVNDEELKFKFDDDFSDKDKNCFPNLFSLPLELFRNLKVASIDKKFMDNNTICDLFRYRGSYYWSVIDRNNTNTNNCEFSICNKQTKIFDAYVKKVIEEGYKNKTIDIFLKGSSDVVIEKISEFIGNKFNRKRISTLDIHMLQLGLLRLNSNYVLGIRQ